jgi:hypothetical protein
VAMALSLPSGDLAAASRANSAPTTTTTLLVTSGIASAAYVDTPGFIVTKGEWTIHWTYNCEVTGSDQGSLGIEVYQGSADEGDYGPGVGGASSSGARVVEETGQFHLSVTASCPWGITVTNTISPTRRLLSVRGAFGAVITPPFTISTAILTWSFDCSGAPPHSGQFGMTIFRGAKEVQLVLPNDGTHTAIIGLDTSYGRGRYTLTITAQCRWVVNVNGSGSPARPINGKRTLLFSPSGNFYRAREFCPRSDLGRITEGSSELLRCARDASYERWLRAY